MAMCPPHRRHPARADAAHAESGSTVSIVTARVPDPTGYGRVVRDAEGQVERIVEQKDASPDEAAIDEINSGIYAFDVAVLRSAWPRSAPTTPGEKYLTDVVRIARESGHRVRATSSTTCGRPRASTTGCSWPPSVLSSMQGSAGAGCVRA